ncbi:MAG: HIT domain-containing protein [Chitinivibrionales bacterium]|nr:HIT domain-containing protein [Chitinivibrionales bacterium]
MEDCIFCKIAKGEIPSEKVYDDEHSVIFKDLNPKAPVHLLAIPKEHYAGVHEIPSDKIDTMGTLYATIGKVVKQENLTENGYRLVINSGKDSGQLVPHIHVHILSGRKLTWPPG